MKDYDNAPLDKILTVEEAAQFLDVDLKKLRKWSDQELRLHFIKRGTIELVQITIGVPHYVAESQKQKRRTKQKRGTPLSVLSSVPRTYTMYPPGLFVRDPIFD